MKYVNGLYAILIITIILTSGCINDKIYNQGLESEYEKVKVNYVIDGDTIEIIHEDGGYERVRLIGIDTPEIFSENSLEEWNGIESINYLKIWGLLSRDYVRNKLLGNVIELRFDDICGRYDKYDRILAYIYIDGENLNKELVSLGYAKVYDYSECEILEQLKIIENKAKSEKRGIWSPNSNQYISILGIVYDAPGNDNSNINEEYIVIRNNSPEDINISNWKIIDNRGPTYVFHDYIIKTKKEIIVRSGSGHDDEFEFYWQSKSAIWNNNGDKAKLYDSNNNLIDEYEYPS